jgi:hypothetical protein
MSKLIISSPKENDMPTVSLLQANNHHIDNDDDEDDDDDSLETNLSGKQYGAYLV